MSTGLKTGPFRYSANPQNWRRLTTQILTGTKWCSGAQVGPNALVFGQLRVLCAGFPSAIPVQSTVCRQTLPGLVKWESVCASSYLLRSSLELSDTKVHEPQIRALLGTASHFCEVVFLQSKTVPNGTTLSLGILRVIRGLSEVWCFGHRTCCSMTRSWSESLSFSSFTCVPIQVTILNPGTVFDP